MNTAYRRFEIEYNPKPIPDRRHDYDAWRPDGEGPEGLMITGKSIEHCKELIDEYWAEFADCAS